LFLRGLIDSKYEFIREDGEKIVVDIEEKKKRTQKDCTPPTAPPIPGKPDRTDVSCPYRSWQPLGVPPEELPNSNLEDRL